MILSSSAQAIGGTPLVALDRVGAGLPGRIVAKLEMMNPGGSVKDRLGKGLIEDAERRGVIRPGATLIESTGGNTGIGLAFAAAIKGYRLILTMPEAMSVERVALLKQLGAEIVLTPGILMAEAVTRAREIAAGLPGSFLLSQFDNPANPEVHRQTTGPEIWQAAERRVDMFVSAVGTGGTITGVGEVLKAHNPAVTIVAVEPSGAAILSGGAAGQHGMPGIGVGFIPAILNRAIIDEIAVVTDEEALTCARNLAHREGIIAGVSSGAALCAALRAAANPAAAGKVIVVLLADTGDRYITTPLFNAS